jgi:hypothetical protein
MVLVLAMLEVDCKSLGGMRLRDGEGNAKGRGGYGVEEGDSGGDGSVAVAGAGGSGGDFTSWTERVFDTFGISERHKFLFSAG